MIAAPRKALQRLAGVTLIGLIVGMIPGLTISTGIIILLPLTFVLDPNISIALLLGLSVPAPAARSVQPSQS